VEAFSQRKACLMSQLVACKNERGIILATDSKALDFDASGQMMDQTVQRLIQLTPYTAILAVEGPPSLFLCLHHNGRISNRLLKAPG
jgi:hypothetical protein